MFEKYIKFEKNEKKLTEIILKEANILFPQAIDDNLIYWEYIDNLKNEIMIPFDLIQGLTINEKRNKKGNKIQNKWINTPDFIKAEIDNDFIYLSSEDLKSDLNVCNSIEQLSQLNLFDLYNNSFYVTSAIEYLKNKFPNKEIILKEGKFILPKNRKNKIFKNKNKKDLEKIIQRYNSNTSQGEINIDEFEPFKIEGSNKLISSNDNYSIEIITVEQLHREIGHVKNRINEKGFFPVPVIVISGFDFFGNSIKKFEYVPNLELKTYSPEIEKIDAKILEIQSWTTKELISENKKARRKYISTLKESKHSINLSLEKLEQRIEFLTQKYPLFNNRIIEINRELQNNEIRYQNLLEKYKNTENLFQNGYDNLNIEKWIDAINQFTTDFEFNETLYNQHLKQLKDATDTNLKNKKQVLINLFYDISDIFPIFSDFEKSERVNPKFYSIEFAICKEYLHKKNILTNELENKYYLINDDENGNIPLEEEIELNLKKMISKKKQIEDIDFKIDEESQKYEKTMQEFCSKDNGYRKTEEYRSSLIKYQDEMKQNILNILENKSDELKRKHKKRLFQDEILNKKMNNFNLNYKKKFDCEIINSVDQRIIYLDIDPIRKEVGKITVFKYNEK